MKGSVQLYYIKSELSQGRGVYKTRREQTICAVLTVILRVKSELYQSKGV
jgi:hypothetical protein